MGKFEINVNPPTMKLLYVLIFTVVTTSITAQEQIQAMSYNIRYDNPNDAENWWENRKQDVSSLIERYQPDFLGIQEGLDHQVQYLNQMLKGYQYVGIGRDGDGVVSEYTAIFYDTSRYTLVATQTFWLSETPEKVSRGWDAALNRICTYAYFEEKATGSVFHVFNTHFDHRGSEARKKSAEVILQKIASRNLLNEKLIVMGDLNSLPESAPVTTLNEVLTDSRKANQNTSTGPEGTFSDFAQDADLERRIDYIFIKNLEVLNQRHVDDLRPNLLWPSDHLPVIAVFK